MRRLKTCFFILTAAFFLQLAPNAATWAAEGPDPVCATRDFADFVEKFAELSPEAQVSCVNYPVKDTTFGKTIKNKAAMRKHLGKDVKLVISPSDAEERERSTPFFTKDPNQIEPLKWGYGLLEADGFSMVNLFEGGTFCPLSLAFKWNGSHWLLEKMSNPEEEME